MTLKKGDYVPMMGDMELEIEMALHTLARLDPVQRGELIGRLFSEFAHQGDDDLTLFIRELRREFEQLAL